MRVERRLRSRTLQEQEIARREHRHDPDVREQPRPEQVPEEQHVYANHDEHHRQHVERDDYLSSHRLFLLRATERSKAGGPAGDIGHETPVTVPVSSVS
jgi:hypothetical protein